MNDTVRKYLIDICRAGKLAYYEDVAKLMDLDLSDPADRDKLSVVLGEVSEYEHSKSRPLISSVAIYKANNDHGYGFYTLCEQLGIGKAKELQESLYGFTQLEECRKFWTNDYNYNHFYNISTPIYSPTKHPFFNIPECDFFKQWKEEVYDKHNDDHINAKNFILSTVWHKTAFWADEVVKRLKGFDRYNHKKWSKMGWDKGEHVSTFKPYTWARIYRRGDYDKNIFFTVGYDAYEEALLYKLDYFKEHYSTLSNEQKRLCEKHIPAQIRWIPIPENNFSALDWEKLISLTVDFISQNAHHYDSLINLVWGDKSDNEFTEYLSKREFPAGGFTDPPTPSHRFTGVNVDFIQKNVQQKELGDAGEELVKRYEKKILEEKGLFDLAAKVEIQKDGVGYDILSFDENEQEVYIEVKTTAGNEKTAFYLSDSEKCFAIQNKGKYKIYRLFNYNDESDSADFFEITDIEKQLHLIPTDYVVYLRKS